jgi:uncharacterized membrane protein
LFESSIAILRKNRGARFLGAADRVKLALPMGIARLLLILHIVAGSIAGLCGIAALASTKGSTLHVRTGRVFWSAMLVVGASSLALALLRPNAFLFLIGVFSTYLVIAGRRALDYAGPAAFDRGLALAMAATGGGMMALAALAWAGVNPLALRLNLLPVLITFGAVALVLVLLDLRDFQRQLDRRERILRHVTRIVPGFIATVTAVAVVNLTFLPELLRWLGPSAILVPLIFVFAARIRRGLYDSAR